MLIVAVGLLVSAAAHADDALERTVLPPPDPPKPMQDEGRFRACR